MLACTFDLSPSNTFGLLCAFGSAIVFVSSNIFFKKIMPTTGSGLRENAMHKLDKLNLLCYSSGMAFLLMIPLWAFYDLPVMLTRGVPTPKVPQKPSRVVFYFILNGTVHFGQNILAFTLLQSTSPVTYSIASLIKRVAVIVIAIIWFGQTVHPMQALGICMTFAGLYMYHGAKSSVDRGELKVRAVEARREGMLPMTKAEASMMHGPSGRSTPDYASLPSLQTKLVPKPVFESATQIYPSPPHSPPHQYQLQPPTPPHSTKTQRRNTHAPSSQSRPISVL
jgi:solute carrier family 35, member E1